MPRRAPSSRAPSKSVDEFLRFQSSLSLLAVVLALVLAGCSGVQSRTPASSVGHRTTALVGGTVYTVPGAAPIPEGAVLIEGGRIIAVGPRASIEIPAAATVIDASGSTVLPGFWNSHVHFMEPKWIGIDTMAAVRADTLLSDMFTRFGFVHVFDISSFPEATLALRRRIRDGEVRGPDILTTLMGFVPPAGTPRYVPFRMPEVASADDARDSVRARIAAGADGIKLFTVPITRRVPFPVMSLDIIRAATAEAHAAGRKVFVHPTNLTGVAVSIAGGADILAHTVAGEGAFPDSLLSEMQRRGVALIPTLTLWEDDFGPDTTEMRSFVRSAQQEVRSFAGRGGRILFGTDAGYIARYDPTREYELMAEAGLDFPAILASLTTAPAEEFGFGERRGQLAAGFDADIVVINGDPVRDIRALANVQLTLKRGDVLYRRPASR